MNLDSFLESLPEDELRKLREKISVKLESSTCKVQVDADSRDLESIYEAFSKVLTSRGFRGIPWNSFRGSKDFSSFSVKADWLSKFVRSNFETKTKVEHSYACLLVSKLLVGWLDRIGVPLSYRVLVKNADRIPSLVDEAFPGYKKAGLLRAVIKQAKN